MLTLIINAVINGAFEFLFKYLGSFQAKKTEVIQDDPQAPVFVDVGTVFDDLGLR